MRDGDFENQNAVSRCGAAVLKTEWDFPDAGQTPLPRLAGMLKSTIVLCLGEEGRYRDVDNAHRGTDPL